MKINLLGIIFLTILVFGCKNQDKQRDFDYGHIEKNKYVNSFFDFEITLPTDWIAQVIDEKGNHEVIHNINSKMKSSSKSSDENTKILLSVYQFKLDSVVDYNPHYAIIAENIKDFPEIKSGYDYLLKLRGKMNQSNVKYNYIDSVFSGEVINGAGFYKMHSEIKINGLDLKQFYYSKVIRGFNFLIVIYYITGQQKEVLMKSINSMKFKK